MKRILFVALVFTFLMQSIGAQNNGYLNYTAVLSEMPETKQVNLELAELRKNLQAEGEEMVAVLQNEYNRLQKLVSGGSSFAPNAFDDDIAILRNREAEIGLFYEEMQLILQKREFDLFKPLKEKLNNIITDVAKENGMQFIFDQGTQMILFAEASTDITSMVKAKLGM